MKTPAGLCVAAVVAITLTLTSTCLFAGDPTKTNLKPQVHESAWSWHEPEYVQWRSEKIEGRELRLEFFLMRADLFTFRAVARDEA